MIHRARQGGIALANIFRDHFFTVPEWVMDRGLLSKLSPSALRLYLALLRLANYSSAVAIELSGEEREEYTGVHSAAAITAREELKAVRLSDWKTGPHGVMTYVLLDEAGDPLPPPLRRNGKPYTGIRKTGSGPHLSGQPSRSTTIRTPPAVPPTWKELTAETPPPQVANQRPEARAGLRESKTRSSRIETLAFANRKPSVRNENKTGGLEEKCKSENFSEEEYISEQVLRPSEVLKVQPAILEKNDSPHFGNPKGYDCFLHGKQVEFSGPFCVACHPGVGGGFKKSAAGAEFLKRPPVQVGHA